MFNPTGTNLRSIHRSDFCDIPGRGPDYRPATNRVLVRSDIHRRGDRLLHSIRTLQERSTLHKSVQEMLL